MNGYQELIDRQDAEAIAQRLRTDQELCKNDRLPSNLAIHLCSAPSTLLDLVAWHITPHDQVSKALRMTRCNGIIKGIKSYLNQLESKSGEEDAIKDTFHIPTDSELETTLKVLDYLQKHKLVSQSTATDPLSDVILTVKGQRSMDDIIRTAQHRKLRGEEQSRKANEKSRCYICRYKFSTRDAHELYPSLCRQCGMFNVGCSELSLPDKLSLTRKFALVTGGRIHLGYAIALRLLRCGANVIVSSRYPADAAARYANEVDYAKWNSRLKVVGADFRAAKDAFRLVHIVKQLLRDWECEKETKTSQYLDILINNAAQTLTDPVKAEIKAIAKEEQLRDRPEIRYLLATTSEEYRPRVRGGAQASWVPSIESNKSQLYIENVEPQDDNENGTTQKGLRTIDDTDSSKSSWVQSLYEVPYEDLISAHSVNAFVPLILCRELLKSMGSDRPHRTLSPSGYIVNVSSREGILEDIPGSRSKAGHHVHTNMSKAAINMITETEAQDAWKERRVAMNSVDPGYMSAAPECQRAEGCPIGFEDGAARVLWPIAIGELEGRVISGRFLKHFQEGISLTRRG